MKINRKRAALSFTLAAMTLCAGCGGISASRGVSLWQIFVPGGLLLKAEPPPMGTNDVVVPPGPYRQLARLQ